LQKSDNLYAEFLFYSQLSKNLHHPPCISGASGKPRDRVPLPRIKYGENLIDKKKDSGEQAACEYPLELARLKNFVQIPDYAGLCVDT
jgi:hypothetical protein